MRIIYYVGTNPVDVYGDTAEELLMQIEKIAHIENETLFLKEGTVKEDGTLVIEQPVLETCSISAVGIIG